MAEADESGSIGSAYGVWMARGWLGSCGAMLGGVSNGLDVVLVFRPAEQDVECGHHGDGDMERCGIRKLDQEEFMRETLRRKLWSRFSNETTRTVRSLGGKLEAPFRCMKLNGQKVRATADKVGVELDKETWEYMKTQRVQDEANDREVLTPQRKKVREEGADSKRYPKRTALAVPAND